MGSSTTFFSDAASKTGPSTDCPKTGASVSSRRVRRIMHQSYQGRETGYRSIQAGQVELLDGPAEIKKFKAAPWQPLRNAYYSFWIRRSRISCATWKWFGLDGDRIFQVEQAFLC